MTARRVSAESPRSISTRPETRAIVSSFAWWYWRERLAGVHEEERADVRPLDEREDLFTAPWLVHVFGWAYCAL